jgi:sugar lactone lactonase YvrE
MLDRKFHKLVLSSDEKTTLETYQLDKMLCSFGLLDALLPPSDDDDELQNDAIPGYVVAWEDGFQLYDLERRRALGPMSHGEIVNRDGLPDRLNDGRVDPTGRRFVCGGCASSGAPLKVYKCEYDSTAKGLKHSVLYDKILTTNSICWSSTGEEMYLADSPHKNIRKFSYNLDEGTIGDGEVIHIKEYGFPDGYVDATQC